MKKIKEEGELHVSIRPHILLASLILCNIIILYIYFPISLKQI